MFIHRRLNENGTSVGPVKFNLLPSDNINYDDEDNSAYQKAYSKNDSDDNDDDDDDEEEDEEDDDEVQCYDDIKVRSLSL